MEYDTYSVQVGKDNPKGIIDLEGEKSPQKYGRE